MKYPTSGPGPNGDNERLRSTVSPGPFQTGESGQSWRSGRVRPWEKGLHAPGRTNPGMAGGRRCWKRCGMRRTATGSSRPPSRPGRPAFRFPSRACSEVKPGAGFRCPAIRSSAGATGWTIRESSPAAAGPAAYASPQRRRNARRSSAHVPGCSSWSKWVASGTKS